MWCVRPWYVCMSDRRPHRLPDTFALRKFLAGMQFANVSRLFCWSRTKVTEPYYANWVTSGALRLERLVAESLMNT